MTHLTLADMPAGTDCTAAIQRAINAELARSTPDNPGELSFGPGVFGTGPLQVSITPEHPLRRIVGNGTTLKLIGNQPKYSRILTVQYDGATDSHPLHVSGLTFDVSKDSQGWDGSYSHEHQGGLFLWGCSKWHPKAGRLRVTVEDCRARDSASDGFYVYSQVVANFVDCTAHECFRGGFLADGDKSDVTILRCKTSGKLRTGIQTEPTNKSVTHIRVIDCELERYLDLKVPNAESTAWVSGTTVKTGEVFLYNGMGVVRFQNCTLPAIKFTLVGYTSFYDCELGGVKVLWMADGHRANQRLEIHGCTIDATDCIWVNTHYLAESNEVRVSRTSGKGGTFLRMSGNGGSRCIVTDCQIDTYTAFAPRWALGRPFSMTIRGNEFGPNVTRYWESTYDHPTNRVEHYQQVPERVNRMYGTRAMGGLGFNTYIGHRVVVADREPASDPGFPGDVWQFGAKQWKCTRGDYARATWEVVS